MSFDTPSAGKPTLVRPFRILAVDDDPAMRALFPVAFRNQPVQLVVAGTEAEAYERLMEKTPDLFLVDFWLGDVNGVEVAERLLKRVGVVVPILVVTAETEGEPWQYIASGRCRGCLTKPINMSTFGGNVLTYLDPSKSEVHESRPQAGQRKSLALGFLENALKTAQDLYSVDETDLLADSRLAQTAHRWIGVSGINGVPEIERESRRLEKLARAEDFEHVPAIRQLLAEIIAKFEATIAELSMPRHLAA